MREEEKEGTVAEAEAEVEARDAARDEANVYTVFVLFVGPVMESMESAYSVINKVGCLSTSPCM